MKGENTNHQLRFSVDMRSIKEHEFTAQLSLRYSPIPTLGLPAFRSASIPLPNARVETKLNDCFASGYYQASKLDMAQKLQQPLEIGLWHCDRLKKDTLLGKTIVQLQKILQMPLRKTSQSFARVLDAYLPIDEVDQQDKPLKTIGSLRVIVYLEDLGPIDQLEKKGFDIKEYLDNMPEEANIPSVKEDNPMTGMESAGLNQLERKVVWELQTWKKAEETKARITLKHKEIEFWTNLSEQQRKSDVQKQKQFKKIEANLILQEGKLRSKMSELSKREQKILLLEQQLQTKITEVSRECFVKDQEIEAIRKRHKDDKNAVIKEKASGEIEIAKLRAQNARLRVQIEQLKKEDDKSPLNILKAELNAKILEIKELSRQVEKANEVKDQYKIYYGKMKDQVCSLRQRLRNNEQSMHQTMRQKDILANNYRHLQQQLAYERQVYQQMMQGAMPMAREDEDEDWHDYQHKPTNPKESLIRQREQLIREGQYSPNDPLILEMQRQIRSYS